jgi:hypothetical protein
VHKDRAHLTRLVTWLAIALALLYPSVALAQEAPPTLESLTIDLWPEFDQPGVLVIYSGQLTAPNDPAAPITLLLPPGVELNAVATLDRANGNLLEAGHEIQTVGESTQITLTSEMDNFWVEFYAPADAITQDGDSRSFSHTWGGDLAVDQLIWHVQQPATASDLAVTPEGGQVGTDTFNLPDYTVEGGAVAAGETASASVSYVKTDDVLSVSQVAPQPAPEAQLPAPDTSPSPAGSAPLIGILPIGLAVLGVALLAGGIFFYWRSGRSADVSPPAEPARLASRPRASRAERAAQQRQDAAGYCTNCGNPLQPGDKFCRECGTPVVR